MIETGSPGSSSSMPEPPPQETVWLRTAPGYRIGVLRGALVIEVMDFHAGYLVMDAKEIHEILESAKPASPLRTG